MGACAGKPSKHQAPQQETQKKPQQESADAGKATNTTDKEAELIKDATITKDISQASVDDTYAVGDELGRGAFSVVRRGVKKGGTGEKVALKFIEKKFVKKKHIEQLRREIDIMQKVNHTNVLALKGIHENDTHLTLVMELVDGGELFYKIVDRGSFTEKDARNVVRQVCRGVAYLHSMGIAHRDLKPENLLCDGDGDNMTIKIADFGLSKIFGEGETLETSCGTPDYVAPEVLTGSAYDNAVDMWSVGVITYILLCGFPPFYAPSQNVLFEKILSADYDFPDPEWTHVSEAAKNFIRHLIVKEPEARYSAAAALEDPWLVGDVVQQQDLHSNFAEKMKKYNEARRNVQPV